MEQIWSNLEEVGWFNDEARKILWKLFFCHTNLAGSSTKHSEFHWKFSNLNRYPSRFPWNSYSWVAAQKKKSKKNIKLFRHFSPNSTGWNLDDLIPSYSTPEMQLCPSGDSFKKDLKEQFWSRLRAMPFFLWENSTVCSWTGEVVSFSSLNLYFTLSVSWTCEIVPLNSLNLCWNEVRRMQHRQLRPPLSLVNSLPSHSGLVHRPRHLTATKTDYSGPGTHRSRVFVGTPPS